MRKTQNAKEFLTIAFCVFFCYNKDNNMKEG